MNGTQWLYEIVDKTFAPLERIYDNLDLTDKAAQRTEDSLHGIGESSGPIDVTANSFDNLGDSIVTAAGGFALYDIGKTVLEEIAATISVITGKVIDTRGEYQKFEAVLTNSFQSAEKGAEVFQMLEQFAGKTPYELDQITNSFIKMNAQGFTPTRHELMKLGDFASYMMKDFDQLAEAVLDAQTGEFERLKEFGVKADAHGEKVKFTFKGVTTEVDKSAGAIRGYLLNLGDMQGVQGSMTAVMDTIPGKLSNINDAQSKLYNNLGKLFEPAINSWYDFEAASIDSLINLVAWVDEHGKAIQDFIGGLATALVAGGAAWVIFNAEMLVGQLVAGGALGVIKLLEAAQWALNIAMEANPIGIVIGLIAALGFMLYELWQNSEDFRGGVMGLWESLKVLGQGIVDFAILPFKLWLEEVQAAGEILLGLFTFDEEMIKSGFDRALKALEDANPVEKMKQLGADMGNAYVEGRDNAIADFRAEQSAEADRKPKSTFADVTSKDTKNDKTGKDGTTTDSTNTSGTGTGRGGVTIQKIELGNNLVINAATVKEGAQQIRNILREEFIAMLRDVEVGMANS